MHGQGVAVEENAAFKRPRPQLNQNHELSSLKFFLTRSCVQQTSTHSAGLLVSQQISSCEVSCVCMLLYSQDTRAPSMNREQNVVTPYTHVHVYSPTVLVHVLDQVVQEVCKTLLVQSFKCAASAQLYDLPCVQFEGVNRLTFDRNQSGCPQGA